MGPRLGVLSDLLGRAEKHEKAAVSYQVTEWIQNVVYSLCEEGFVGLSNQEL